MLRSNSPGSSADEAIRFPAWCFSQAFFVIAFEAFMPLKTLDFHHLRLLSLYVIVFPVLLHFSTKVMSLSRSKHINAKMQALVIVNADSNSYCLLCPFKAAVFAFQ